MDEKINKKSKIFEIIVIILIILFAISITPKTLQNDTFYTIKVGELIVKNHNIDMKERFSWHEGLKYTYPHWLYDVIIYLIYNMSGMVGIYISTCVFSAILGVIFFEVNKKINKNYVMSFFITILAIYMLKDFITARAQLVTYILFVLQIYCIEKLLKTANKKYGIYLIIISLLMVNLHVAVWPFSFILYLPYIVEYIIAIIIYKKRKNIGENQKLLINRNENTKILIIFMIICAFTGIITPLGATPYTYLINTMKGTTTAYISEHAPIVIINNMDVICVIGILLEVLIFTKTKIKLSDLLMLSGLTLLMFYSQRQKSIFIIIGLIFANRIIYNFFEEYYDKLDEILIEGLLKKWVIAIIILSLTISDICLIVGNNKQEYIDETIYPVNMSEYILSYFKDIGFENLRLFNEYNYGSYLLYKGIPVFIDSRADLYSPEFNKGVNIFEDFMKINNLEKDFEEIVEKYKITHIILNKNYYIYKTIKKIDNKYKLLKEDDNFVFYEVI